MVFIWCLISLVLSTVTELHDGETLFIDNYSENGFQSVYSFYISQTKNSDLVVSLTGYSDYQAPDMFLRVDQIPTISEYDYSSNALGYKSIKIPSESVQLYKNYYVLVICYSYCMYGITLSITSEVKLHEGIPINRELNIGKQELYSFIPGFKSDNILKITVSNIIGKADLYVSIGQNSQPNDKNSEIVNTNWDQSLEYTCKTFNSTTIFKASVIATENAAYTILAKILYANTTYLQAGTPVQSEVGTEKIDYYYINVLSPNDNLAITLTLFTGDADIYVSAEALPTIFNYNFSSIHMGNENLIITSQDRKNIGKSIGKYYIGIYGFNHASFALSVRNSNYSVIKLKPGIPQSGSVNQSLFEYYLFEFPLENANITVSISAESGNSDLYVRICKGDLNKCFFTEYDFRKPMDLYTSTRMAGEESVEILHNPSVCPKNVKCAYLVGVYGADFYSTFSVVVTNNKTDEIVLRAGRPFTNVLMKNDYIYYKFTTINNTVYEVDFIITPTYGDCDIYACFNSFCSIENLDLFDKRSLNTGLEIDQINYIKGVDCDSLTGTFHIMVYAKYDTSFSILAKETVTGKNTTIQIYPGHPQKDTLYNNINQNYRLYFFPIHFPNQNKQKIVISLSALAGNFSIYVANQLSNIDYQNNIFHYNWRNDISNHTDPYYIINILPSDPLYKIDTTYLILIIGENYLPDNTSTYVIGFTSGESNMILTEDTPYTGIVVEDTYNYYIFPIYYSNEDITISITAMTGDPDMFISIDPSNPNPTINNYNFRSTTFGSEFITLIWEDGLRKKCSKLPENYHFGDKNECFVFIGVYGFETSTYVIRVHPNKNSPMILTLGQPLNSNVNMSLYNFYYTIVDTTLDLHISLQPIIGDPDLFVNILDLGRADNVSDWTRPIKNNCDFASESTVMSEEINIESLLLQNICPSKMCLVLSSVYCYSEVCAYSITAKQNEIQALIENQAIYGSIDKGYIYYSYYCDKDLTNFLVTVTSFDGNPDLFISKGKDSRPNSSVYMWFSNSWGGDSILITSDDNYFEGKTMKGTYIIGIYSESGPSSFSIVINNNPIPILSLTSGVPQYGNATKLINYYSFYNVIIQDITISITPISGSGQFYAKPYFDSQINKQSRLPNNNNNYWSSTKSLERYYQIIKTTDYGFCTYCEIVIGIQSDQDVFIYSITASNALNITILQNGIVTKGEVQPEKWSVYSFEVLKSIDIDISLTPFTGHPNIYVSTSKNWTWENYAWMENYAEDAITITINTSDNKFKLGTYYIIIQSYSYASYSIIAHTKDVPVMLVDGLPVSYALKTSSLDYIQMRLLINSGSKVFCTLYGLKNFRPEVYTKFQEPFTKYENTGPLNYSNHYKTTDYQQEYNKLNITLEHKKNKPTQLNLGIYSIIDISEDKYGRFQIFCSSLTQTTILSIGSMHIEMLDEDIQRRSYEMSTPSKGTLDVYVIPCIGNFKLEISSNWTLFSQDSPDVTVTRMTDGMLSRTISGANGRYYISVSSLNTSIPYKQIYEIMSVFTKYGDDVLKSVSPGKNGLISWENQGKNNLTISWFPVENDGIPIENMGVEYKVYFTPDKHFGMVTACGIYFFQSRGEATFLGSTKKTDFNMKFPMKKGFVNVVGVVPKSYPSPIKEIVYDPTEILIDNISVKNEESIIIYWVLGILVFLALSLSFYLYKKKKRIEKVFNYEMSDIRNIATVVKDIKKPKSSSKNPYSPLSNIN